MTTNELTHNATGDRENRLIAPLGTTTPVTFTVDSSGNITGDADASAGDSFAVNNAAGQSFTGAIYAVRGTTNKTQQLITQNASSMTVGTTYTLKSHTNTKDYTITSTQPTNNIIGMPQTTDGTLRVGSGSGGGDDDADGDGHGGGGHQ